jgi:hypothetical protein
VTAAPVKLSLFCFPGKIFKANQMAKVDTSQAATSPATSLTSDMGDLDLDVFKNCVASYFYKYGGL